MLEPPDRPHDVRCQSLCTSRLVDGTCAWKHFSHTCNCDEIAQSDGKREAEAFADWHQTPYGGLTPDEYASITRLENAQWHAMNGNG